MGEKKEEKKGKEHPKPAEERLPKEEAKHQHVEHKHATHAAKEHDHKEHKEHKGKREGKQAPKAGEAKGAKPAKEKPVKKEKKSRKVVVKRSKEVVAAREKALRKGGLPTFKGHFGKRNIRKKSKDKWSKWRFPRGIDVRHDVSEGAYPKEGYRTPRKFRGVHPSGYREFRVDSLNDLVHVPDNHAIRVSAGLGRKKKMLIVDKAIEKGVKVLNP